MTTDPRAIIAHNLGQLMLANAELTATNARLMMENTNLKARLKDLEKEDGPNDEDRQPDGEGGQRSSADRPAGPDEADGG